jgi:hypothetical protein
MPARVQPQEADPPRLGREGHPHTGHLHERPRLQGTREEIMGHLSSRQEWLSVRKVLDSCKSHSTLISHPVSPRIIVFSYIDQAAASAISTLLRSAGISRVPREVYRCTVQRGRLITDGLRESLAGDKKVRDRSPVAIKTSYAYVEMLSHVWQEIQQCPDPAQQ